MNSQGGKEQKMRKLLKSKKALSPVVAAIILIAVTVAVSIAVAAWMGSMTFTFMETEQLSITSAAFSGTNTITVAVLNTGTTDIIITNTTTVTGNSVTAAIMTGGSVTAGGTASFTITTTQSFVTGSPYNIELLSTKGNKFSYTATA